MEFASERMKRWRRGDGICRRPNEEMSSFMMEHHKRKTELERDVVEQELDRNCEMFRLLMN